MPIGRCLTILKPKYSTNSSPSNMKKRCASPMRFSFKGRVCSGSRSKSSKSFYLTHPSKQPRRTTLARQHLQTPTVGNFRFGAGRNYWRNRLSCRWCSADEGPIVPRRKEKQQLQVFSPSIPRRSHGDRLF